MLVHSATPATGPDHGPSATQNLVNLVVVAPLIVVLGIRASARSLRAYLVWLGCLVPLVLPWIKGSSAARPFHEPGGPRGPRLGYATAPGALS